jgi:hypothetical protein
MRIIEIKSKYNDKLIIEFKKKYVVFTCLIDNNGNNFRIGKEELKKLCEK